MTSLSFPFFIFSSLAPRANSFSNASLFPGFHPIISTSLGKQEHQEQKFILQYACCSWSSMSASTCNLSNQAVLRSSSLINLRSRISLSSVIIIQCGQKGVMFVFFALPQSWELYQNSSSFSPTTVVGITIIS